ncbi:MAG TPA: class I SAM-dependent methyltransferase [Planctomycetaceae bacterium]|nr:class I SAM-dependent methyltransferase [Planctomycetaceae bacterium]
MAAESTSDRRASDIAAHRRRLDAALPRRRQAKKPAFPFGANWRRFLATLSEERIVRAQRSLAEFLGDGHLEGRSFLDVGCGSGLFSLAARRLGARVYSFDCDPECVACARDLRQRYFPDDPRWTVEQGSVLDAEFLEGLGTFDIVYAWGVLHHTGDMWRAMEAVASRVARGGTLYLAIYNDQGWASRVWRCVKRCYCLAPRGLRWVILIPAAIRLWAPTMLKDLVRHRCALATWRRCGEERGMSPWHDIVDWVGGYPFECARPDAVQAFYVERGFALERLRIRTGRGCNEYLLRHSASHALR